VPGIDHGGRKSRGRQEEFYWHFWAALAKKFMNYRTFNALCHGWIAGFGWMLLPAPRWLAPVVAIAVTLVSYRWQNKRRRI